MENKKYLSKIGLALLIPAILIFVLQTVAGHLYVNNVSVEYQKYSFLVTMGVMYLIGLPFMMFLITRIPKSVELEQKKFKFSQMLCFFLVAYSAMYLANLVGTGIAQVIGAIKGSPVMNNLANIATGNELWINLLIIVFCAPIYEELIFRKLLMDRTLRFGEKYAVVLSGLIFGFFHGNLYQFCYATVIGMIFAYIYAKSGKIIYTIILHMIVNFMGSVVGVLIIKNAGIDKLMNAQNMTTEEFIACVTENLAGIAACGLYVLMILALVIAGIVVFVVNKHKISFKEGLVTIPKGEVFKTTVLNVGMGLFFLAWTAMIIVQTLI